MRALEEWSFDELVDAHAVLDALDRVDERAQRDAVKAAQEKQK